eukprot:TRINITY_DN4257_c0_g1_i1.p1 TRINITY_DN4257_c0_g1~~TRINITY_DN4257_c0_g1_i1.p1  ORF type:complete len:327 (-),score=74.42 TRINITY_DN4257_c0_g1_i1:46-1026(-)
MEGGGLAGRADDGSLPIIYSSEAGAYFADLLSTQLNIPRGNVIHKVFGDGEDYYRINIEDRNSLVGRDVILVCPTNDDKDFLELQRVGYGLASMGTRRRIFCIPYMGYSTMERAVLPGEIVSAKTNICMMSSIPSTGMGNTFLFLDLHVQGLLHYFEGPCVRTELYAEDVLKEGVRQLNLENFMFASADLGRPKWVESFARHFLTDIAFIRKSRSFETTQINDVIGEVAGKNVIIYDDMTRSAGTLISAAMKYLECGALSVYALLSHLALNNEKIVDLVEESPLVKVIGTNSHPMSQHPRVKASSKFVILDVSPTYASVLKNHFLK